MSGNEVVNKDKELKFDRFIYFLQSSNHIDIIHFALKTQIVFNIITKVIFSLLENNEHIDIVTDDLIKESFLQLTL